MKKRHTTIILGLTLLKMCLSCTSEKHNEVSETFTNNSGKDITAYSYKKSATDTVYTIKDTVIKIIYLFVKLGCHTVQL